MFNLCERKIIKAPTIKSQHCVKELLDLHFRHVLITIHKTFSNSISPLVIFDKTRKRHYLSTRSKCDLYPIEYAWTNHYAFILLSDIVPFCSKLSSVTALIPPGNAPKIKSQAKLYLSSSLKINGEFDFARFRVDLRRRHANVSCGFSRLFCSTYSTCYRFDITPRPIIWESENYISTQNIKGLRALGKIFEPNLRRLSFFLSFFFSFFLPFFPSFFRSLSPPLVGLLCSMRLKLQRGSNFLYLRQITAFEMWQMKKENIHWCVPPLFWHWVASLWRPYRFLLSKENLLIDQIHCPRSIRNINNLWGTFVAFYHVIKVLTQLK